MKEMEVTTNGRISELLEEILVKLSYLLSEVCDGTNDEVDEAKTVKDETKLEEIMVKNELCGERSFASCNFKI